MSKAEFLELEGYFSAAEVALLRGLGSLAEDYGTRIFLVGGCVRDVLIGAPTVDFDFMVEAEVSGFLRHLRENWGGFFSGIALPKKPQVFKKFLTAKLPMVEEISPGLDILDFSTVRKESYPCSGSIPDVEMGTLATDLLRRDFSINALAILLNPEQQGLLIDQFDGREDLQTRSIKVLHNRSFIDDPARCLRAVRFMVRLGAQLEEGTSGLFSQAIADGLLGNLHKRRLGDEFLKCLKEEEAGRVLRMLESYGILRQIDEDLTIPLDDERRGLALFAALLANDEVVLERKIEKFAFRKPDAEQLREICT